MTDTQDLDQALKALHDAIADEGYMPTYHREIMARHREEWPTLWKAIDALLEARPSTEKPE